MALRDEIGKRLLIGEARLVLVQMVFHVRFSVQLFICFFGPPLLLLLSPLFFAFLLFLDATSHLYKRSCPSVGP